jgi:hypothetical protein
MPLNKIVSGGQTGVDRAALDAALAQGIACGGWCPKGRRAEDGAIPGHYPLSETDSGAYEERTRLNVRDSDATLILASGPLEGGTELTAEEAQALGHPSMVVDLDEAPGAPGAPKVRAVADWIAATEAATLNVAGPRESTAPGIHAAARKFLEPVLVAVSGRS